jgi:hypothetical protein
MSNPTPPGFIIGVFSQPVSSFAKWRARGINTLVSHEPESGKMPKADWEAAAAAAGLFFMDYPGVLPLMAAEGTQPYRLAWMQDDEPDLTRTPNASTNPDGTTPAGYLKGRYDACKAANPSMPVFLNLAGPQFTSDAYKGEKHLPYIQAADWLAHDWYVKNKNFARYPVDLIGKAMDRLAAWSSTGITATPPVMTPGKGKPQFVFIECSDQKIAGALGRAPTPDEMEAEVNLAVARGAKGIIYFPQRPPPGFMFDAMTPDLVTRMTAINAKLAPPVPAPPPAPSPTDLLIGELVERSVEQENAIARLSDRLDAMGATLTAATANTDRKAADLAASLGVRLRAMADVLSPVVGPLGAKVG